MGDSSFNGGWIFAFLIIAVIFGWGGGLGGNNAAMAGLATTAEVQNSINAAFADAVPLVATWSMNPSCS